MAHKHLLTTLLIATAAAAAFTTAPTASAYPRDDFLAELADLNIVMPWPEQADTVAAGYHTCDNLRQGVSVLDEMANVEKEYNLPPGQGTLFVSAATTNLCPDFAAG
jgi:hypothetical protein